MDFGTLMKVAFSDPKPEYEFTRMKFVWIINEYIRGSLQKNLLRPHFGVSGTVEYPPASPVPYLFAPDSGNRCAAISAFVSGKVTEAEYDKVAQSSKPRIPQQNACTWQDGSGHLRYSRESRSVLRSRSLSARTMTTR